MDGPEESRTHLAGVLGMIFEAQKGNADVVGMKLQESAERFVLASGLTEPPTAASETDQVRGLLTQENSLTQQLCDEEDALPENVLPPNGVAQMGAGTRKRLRSGVEIWRASARKQQPRKTVHACSFYNNTTHNSRTCPEKQSLGLVLEDVKDKLEVNQRLQELEVCPFKFGPEEMQTPITYRLPTNTQSIIIHGSGMVRDIKVALLSVLVKGNKRHIKFH